MDKSNLIKRPSVIIGVSILILISTFVVAADKVILYEHTGFKGDELRISKNVPDLNASPYYFGPKTSSLKLLVIEPVAVYSGINYTGTCQTITTPISSFKGTAVGNDKIQSIKLNSRCEEIRNAVILFKDKNYRGESLILKQNVSDLKTKGFNDKTSSLQLKGIGQVAVYQHKDYFGKCHTYNADSPDVSTGIGNDKISSIRLRTNCDAYKILKIYNAAGFNIRYYLNGRLQNTLKLTDWHEWSMRKNQTAKVKIEWWSPGGKGDEHWKPLCEYDIKMDSNITVKTHSVIHKGKCEVEHKY